MPFMSYAMMAGAAGTPPPGPHTHLAGPAAAIAAGGPVGSGYGSAGDQLGVAHGMPRPVSDGGTPSAAATGGAGMRSASGALVDRGKRRSYGRLGDGNVPRAAKSTATANRPGSVDGGAGGARGAHAGDPVPLPGLLGTAGPGHVHVPGKDAYPGTDTVRTALEQTDAVEAGVRRRVRANTMHTICLSCGTDKSLEWRRGPDGLNSLCNACGLRYARLKRHQARGKDAGAAPSVAHAGGSAAHPTNVAGAAAPPALAAPPVSRGLQATDAHTEVVGADGVSAP